MASPLTAINVSDNLNSSATRTKSKQLNQEFALPWDSIHRDQVDDHVTKAHQRDDLSKSNIGAVSEYSISHRPEKSKHHVCIICTRAFSRLEHLTRHVLSHTKEKPFPCETCGRYFARRDLVLRHRQKVHILLTSIESHTASKGTNKKRVGQLISKEDGSVYVPTEGTRVTDWCAVSNEKCHADISTFASVLPEKKPADNHDSMFHNLANTNIHEDLDTAAMLRPRKDHIVLNPLQEGNQGTTPSFDDSDKEADPLFLDHLFLDHYATLNTPLHPPDEASQSLILDNATSLSNHDAHGKFADGGITGDASDSNWAKDFHAGMITETEEETAAAGAYGEVLLGTFSNDTPTSQQRRQPTQSLQTETDVSSLMNMDFQTFEDPAAYTGSIHAGTLPCHHHVFDPKFPTFPSLSFESAMEMGSTKSDGRTSDNTTPPSPPPPPPPENKYAVILKIRYGSKVHSTLLKLRENTRSCIERQAKEYIWANFLQPHVSPGRRWTSRLLSVVVKEDETDISGYEDDDLTFLLEFNSQHNVSQFTVKVDYTSV